MVKKHKKDITKNLNRKGSEEKEPSKGVRSALDSCYSFGNRLRFF